MDNVSETSWKQLPHVDVRINEVEPRQGVLDLVRRLRPQWKLQDVQMKRFTDGITNQLIGCFVGSLQDPGVILVRLYGQMTELFVDRERELEIFKLFHSHGCGPEIYCSFQNGICYQFVRGEVLDDLRLHQPAIYRLIAAELGRIHSIKPRGGGPVQPCLWSKMSHFLSLLQENICSGQQQQGRSAAELCWLPSIHTLAAEMEELKTHLLQLDSPTVLCHNDLLTKNIIYNHSEGGVKFIDYEYADYNYQAFDIGNHFNEFAVFPPSVPSVTSEKSPPIISAATLFKHSRNQP
ncbi:ethanolamine kinase 1-like isoform X2 [Nelusetta ayraudi]|uniref:ethanolamine kinase 1-like isoform X2 n=1 Tax=Nelusetta ayraudi TaxID=303726 RepID=UPI003F71A513